MRTFITQTHITFLYIPFYGKEKKNGSERSESQYPRILSKKYAP